MSDRAVEALLERFRRNRYELPGSEGAGRVISNEVEKPSNSGGVTPIRQNAVVERLALVIPPESAFEYGQTGRPASPEGMAVDEVARGGLVSPSETEDPQMRALRWVASAGPRNITDAGEYMESLCASPHGSVSEEERREGEGEGEVQNEVEITDGEPWEEVEGRRRKSRESMPPLRCLW